MRLYEMTRWDYFTIVIVRVEAAGMHSITGSRVTTDKFTDPVPATPVPIGWMGDSGGYVHAARRHQENPG